MLSWVLALLLSADVVWARDDVSEVRWMDFNSAWYDMGTSTTLSAANVITTSLLHSDFSGDGVPDLIIGGRNGVATRRGVASTDPLRVINSWSTKDTEYGNAVNLAYGDFDRDGDMDLFVVWGGRISSLWCTVPLESCA